MTHGSEPGQIDGAADALLSVREAVLQAVSGSPSSWMGLSLDLQLRFSTALRQNNEAVGLSPSEIDYAVVGVGQVCQLYIHALIAARMSGSPLPDFRGVYADWLNSTVLISRIIFPYQHHGRWWSVRVVKHAYGLVGLIVDTGAETYHVCDTRLICPAQGFMTTLLHEVAARIAAAFAEETQRESQP